MIRNIFCAIALSFACLLPSSAAPVISEFMATNNSSLYDEDGASSDWIELHNPDQNPIDLGSYYLTNDPANRTLWRLPSPTLLPGGGTLVVFASNKDRKVGELHTNFKLSKDAGSYLALIGDDGQSIIHEFANYPEQFEDFSYGLAQTGSATTQVLVRENDACSLLVPTSDIGETWKDLLFDDGTWRAATTGIGYERSGGYETLFGSNADVEAETYDENSTVYIRIPFSVASFDGLTKLTFRMKYDDGFIAYLNGVQVASGNPPTDPPTWNSDAGSDHADGLAVVFEDTDITAHVGILATNNLLAIHSMNGDTLSSDLLALPRIEAEYVSNPGLGGPGYFQQSSPGSANGTAQGLPAGPVTASIPGRGFTGSLSVALTTPSPSAQIRYTTNGDVPTASSTLYTSPVNIGSSTLLRARSFDAGLAPGAVTEEGYIRLSSTALSFDSDIPVVIMERFSGGPSASNGKAFTFFAFFEPDPNTGRTTLNRPYELGTRGGWKVRGSSSAGFSKKAYSIEAWDETNSNKDVSPFGMAEESDWILNARSVFDRSLMRNAFIYELSRQSGRYATRTRFVELFKDDNGGDLSFTNDYDGVYTFMEKISRDKERVDVERLPASVTSEPGIAGGYMLKVDRLDPGDGGLSAGGRTLGWVYPKEDDVTTAQANWARDYINNMNAALNAPNYADPVNGYAQYIDVDSWVDHHLLNVLALNADALRLSTYFFKTRTGKIEFGPIWDFDRSMESTDGRDDNPSTWSGGTNYFTYPWWARLFTDENFWQKYIDRYFELREGPFSTSNVHAIIDGMAAELDESQVRNFQRWSDQPRFGSYQGEVNHLKNWLGTRLSWMDAQFAPRVTSNRAAGIYPAGTTVTLSAPLTGGQKIFYTLDGADPRPASDGGTVTGTTLFDETQPIRVIVPPNDIGATWRGGNEPFNDNSWTAGTNGVGYERSSGYENYINVDMNTAMANRTTCYVRIPFNVDGAELATWNFLTLQMRYDDGFVAYLNGTRIMSSNDPANLNYLSSAEQTNDDGSAINYENFNVSAFLSSLQAGQNILAIHALNESTGSSDFLMQARIVAGFDEGANNGVGGIEYTGPITLSQTTRIFARVFDPTGGHSTNSGQTPVGTGWSAPLELEYLVNEVPASAANLVISEIMHDPYDLGDALTDDGEFEWVELLNTSGGPISLRGVRFVEGIEFTFPGRTLAPGERVLVVRNQSAFEQVYGTGRNSQIAGEFNLAFDNLGELIVLTAANGSEIQSFTYSNTADGWPRGADNGYSLQFASGDPKSGASWSASRSLLGSPGSEDPDPATLPDIFINEALTHSVLPQVDTIELFNPNPGDLNLGGWFLTDDLGQPQKFRIPDDTMITGGGHLSFDETDFNTTPGVDPSFALDSFGEEIFLMAATPTGERMDYVSGFDFGDASAGIPFGRHQISTGDAHFVPLVSTTFGNPNSLPVAGPLVVTELMYHPAAFESEFIEIQNVSAQPVSLANAEVSGVGFVFDPTAPDLAPGEIAVLSEIDPTTFRTSYNVPAGVAVYGPYPGKLDNGGERVRVRLPESTAVPAEPNLLVAVDTVIYSDDLPWPASADGIGNSLERVAPGGYGGEPLNWQASMDVGGSPGIVGFEPVDWRSQFFTEAELNDENLSGLFADADGDRLVNALEYLLGSDLRNAASQSSLGARVAELAGRNFFELSFTLRDGVTEFIAEIQQSPDLQSWSSAASNLTQISNVPNGDGTSTVTYQGNSEIDPAVDLYFRVQAVEVVP